MRSKNKKQKLVKAIALGLALSAGIYAPAAEAVPMPPFTGLIEVTGLAGIGFVTVVGVPPAVMGIDEVFAPGNSILGGIHLLGEGMTLDMTGMAVAGGLVETGIKNSITLGNMAGAIVTTGQSYFELASTGAYAGAILNAGTLDVNGQLIGDITGTGSMMLIANGYLTIGSTGGVVGSINATCGDINIDNGSLAGNIVTTKGSVNVTGGQGSVVGDKGNIAGNIINTTGNVNFDNYADIKTIVAGANSIDTVGGDVSVMDHSTITSNNSAINNVTGNVDVGNASTINTQNSAIANTGGNVTISGKNTQVIAATGNAIENTGGDVLINDKALVESKTGSAVFDTQGDVIVGGGILKSKDDTIKNVEGQVIIQTGSEVTSSEGWAISGVKGSIKIEEGAKVVGKKGAFAGANGSIEITRGSFNSTEGDGFVSGANQNGVINMSDTTVNAQKNGVDLSGGTSKTTTLTNVDIVAAEGNGLNVSGRSQVALNGLNITAGATGLVADNVERLDINTTLDDHMIKADNVGMLVSNGTKATLAGTKDLTMSVGKNGTAVVGAPIGAGIQVEGANFDVNQGGKVVLMELTGNTAGLVGSGAGSTLNFNNAQNSITTATGVVADSVGGLLSTDAAIVNMDKGSINLVGKEAFGVQAQNGGALNLSNLDDRFVVQATNGLGVGAMATGAKAVANLHNIQLAVSGTGTATAVGLMGTDGGTVNLSNSYTAEQLATNPKLSEMNITAVDGTAIGIQAAKGGIVNIVDDTAATPQSRTVLPAEAKPLDSNLETLNISTTGKGMAIGISSQGLDTSINLGPVKNIMVHADGTGDAIGLQVTDSSIFSNRLETLTVNSISGNATGIQASNQGQVNLELTGDAKVSAGKTALGILASGGEVNLKGVGKAASKLIVTGTEPSAVLAVEAAGKINLTNMSVALGDTTTGLLLQGTKNGGTVNAQKSLLIGNAIYDADAAVIGESNRLTISLAGGSMMAGAVNVVNDNDPALHKGATIDMNVNSGSAWYMTSDSDLRGTLNNTGIIEIAPLSKEKLTYSTLKADKLSGNGGTYIVNTTINNTDSYLDKNKRQSDLIVALGSPSDTKAALFIKNDDKKVAWYQERMDQDLVITAPNSTTQLTLANGQNAYELGAWAYQLKAETINKAQADKLYGGNYGGATGWHLQNFDLSNQARAALSSVVSPDVWYLETNALYSNINQYDNNKAKSNVWAQVMHGKFENSNTIGHAGYSGNNEVEQNFNGLTAGIDKKLSSTDRGDFWGGLMFGHGTGDISYYGGSTDLKSTHVGLYGIYHAASDWYMGGVLKYNRYSSDIGAMSRAGQYIANDYSQHGWGASIMAGKKTMRSNGWFVEPQIEFGYNKVSGTNYTFGNGMDVNVGDSSSLRLRGGVAIGRQHVYNDGAKLDTYLKLSLVHEFDGESTVNLYGEPFKVDYGGTWGQYKLGTNFTSANNMEVNLALTYENGGDKKSPLGVEAGVKWSF